jgi:nucleoid-associated protein YgaU
MNFKQIKRKYFKSSEEVISMFLGLVIVVVVGGLIFNYFQKSKGVVDIPGSSDDITLTNETTISNKKGSYEVLLGDSLWKIADKKYGNGYAWTEIAKVNNLENPSTLEAGQNLIIPEKVEVNGEEFKLITSVIAENSVSIVIGEEYQVVKGDSLWNIAVEAYGDGYQWPQIWQENKEKLPDANGLEIGMTLMIPKLN